MKEHLIQLRGHSVSNHCRSYTYQVTDPSGDTRQFQVDVSLELFRTSPLKFQDGPLISRERLQNELDGEPNVLAKAQLNVAAPDIVGYLERHYPPKARGWNAYKPR